MSVDGSLHAASVIRALRSKRTASNCTDEISRLNEIVRLTKQDEPTSGQSKGGVEYSAEELSFYRDHITKASTSSSSRAVDKLARIPRQPPNRTASPLWMRGSSAANERWSRTKQDASGVASLEDCSDDEWVLEDDEDSCCAGGDERTKNRAFRRDESSRLTSDGDTGSCDCGAATTHGCADIYAAPVHDITAKDLSIRTHPAKPATATSLSNKGFTRAKTHFIGLETIDNIAWFNQCFPHGAGGGGKFAVSGSQETFAGMDAASKDVCMTDGEAAEMEAAFALMVGSMERFDGEDTGGGSFVTYDASTSVDASRSVAPIDDDAWNVEREHRRRVAAMRFESRSREFAPGRGLLPIAKRHQEQQRRLSGASEIRSSFKTLDIKVGQRLRVRPNPRRSARS